MKKLILVSLVWVIGGATIAYFVYKPHIENDRRKTAEISQSGDKTMAGKTFDEKRLEGCGTLYITKDEALRVAAVLIDLIVDTELEFSRVEISGFIISAEIDEDSEDGILLSKVKVKEGIPKGIMKEKTE